MSVLVGSKAPVFTTQAVMANGEITGDYTPVLQSKASTQRSSFTQWTSRLCVHPKFLRLPIVRQLLKLSVAKWLV